MRYLALATDYDGTIAHDGQLDEATIAALRRLRASGRQLLLVTGRELDDLQRVCPALEIFDRVVAENGALLYTPATKAEQALGERPPEAFVRALRARGVAPLSVGRVIVATWEPHQTAVLDVIREQGLELQVSFNKGAVMVLPSGINKAAGLAAALLELGLSPHNTVGVGDAENDHAFLQLCEASVAVSNALPALKQQADLVTAAARGAGVVELIEQLLADDLLSLEPRLTRHWLPLGTQDDGSELTIAPYGPCLLLAGSSGGGKSTLATVLLEQLTAHGYQFCIIDPEGDYEAMPGAVVLGSPQQPPETEQVLELLRQPQQQAVVNLLAIPAADRPAFFADLLSQLQDLRARSGRPHWIVVDEAHHMLHRAWEPAALTWPQLLHSVVLVTVDPRNLARSALEAVDTIIAVGEHPERTIAAFCAVVEQPAPPLDPLSLAPDEALAWERHGYTAPVGFSVLTPAVAQQRHRRKYAQGDMGGNVQHQDA